MAKPLFDAMVGVSLSFTGNIQATPLRTDENVADGQLTASSCSEKADLPYAAEFSAMDMCCSGTELSQNRITPEVALSAVPVTNLNTAVLRCSFHGARCTNFSFFAAALALMLNHLSHLAADEPGTEFTNATSR